MPITAPQTRAARAIAGVTQRQLAAATGLALSTVAEFESGARDTQPTTLETIKAALEARGVLFLSAGREGVGVRLRRHRDNAGDPS
jgi:transcriptional regulator with XRE-family HTH domain